MNKKSSNDSSVPEASMQNLGELYLNGRYEEAEVLALSLIEKFPENVKLYHILGSTLKKSGRLNDALAANRKTISLFPDSAQAHNNMGNTLRELNKIEEAIESYRKAILLKPTLSEAHLGMGLSLVKLKKDEEAALSFNETLSLNPVSALAHYHLGNISKKLGNIYEAEESYKKAIKLKPRYAETYNNLGIIYTELGRNSEAEANFKKAVELQPKFALAFNNLGNFLKQERRYYEAYTILKKAIELDPDLVEPRMKLNEVSAKAVPIWHLSMMNDSARNDAYFAAINRAVEEEMLVLEIGTGSGLLSMMAADSGAKKVITSETIETISKTAREIIYENGYEEKITVLNKKSTELIVGEDLPRKADILISEILSSEFVGEGVRTTLADANARLLKDGGKVIPESGKIRVALIGDSSEILSVTNVASVCGYDLSKFNSITANKINVKLENKAPFLSNPKDAFDICLNDPNKVVNEKKSLELQANKNGTCVGIIQWMSVKLYEDIQYENIPGDVSSHWSTPIYLFDKPIKIRVGERVSIKAFLGKDSVWFYK